MKIARMWCIHRQCVDMHRTAIICIFTQNAQLFPSRHRHSKTARWMMLLLTSRRMMNIVHAHVNIEEDAPASEQATSDYHRLLRGTRLGCHCCFFTLWARKGSWLTLLPLDHHPAKSKRHFWSDHSLILGCNSLRFGCFILKCSQVHEMIHQPWLCLVIWLVFWTTKRPDNSLWIIKSGGGNPDTIIVFTESRNLASLKLVVHRGWETAEGDWKRKQWAKK